MLALADGQARTLKNDYLGTEHILLGVLEDGRSKSAVLLCNLGDDLSTAKKELRRVVQTAEVTTSGELPWTPRCYEVLEYTIVEADQCGHGTVTVEHIVIAITQVKCSVAVQILANLAVDLSEVRGNLRTRRRRSNVW